MADLVDVGPINQIIGRHLAAWSPPPLATERVLYEDYDLFGAEGGSTYGIRRKATLRYEVELTEGSWVTTTAVQQTVRQHMESFLEYWISQQPETDSPVGLQHLVTTNYDTHPEERSHLHGYLAPVARFLHGQPQVLPAAPAKPTRSRWAKAVGPVYTASRVATLLDIALENVQHSIEHNAMLAIKPKNSANFLLPVAQFRDGEVAPAMTWILAQLTESMVDRPTLAAWMNAAHPDVDDLTIWEALKLSGGELTDQIRGAVVDFRHAALR